MLVLSRKRNEKTIIGDNIEVTVIDIQHGRVKLGFRCPPEIAIHRSEVWFRIAQEDDAEAPLEMAHAEGALVR